MWEKGYYRYDNVNNILKEQIFILKMQSNIHQNKDKSFIQFGNHKGNEEKHF